MGGARNCAAHQLSTALGLDYERLWDDFRSLFEAQSLPGEFDYVTPAIVCDWAQKHGHSCYFVKHGALLYKNVIDGHKQAVAFTEDRNHMLLYTTAAPFQNMVVKAVKAIPLQVLPTAKLDKSPAWSEWRPWRRPRPYASPYTRKATCQGCL